MTKAKKANDEASRRSCPPSMDPENRMQQVGMLGIDLLEQRLRSGKATGAEIIYAAQLADPNRILKKNKLASETKLIVSKKDALESSQRTEELYQKAIKAMAHYQGRDNDVEDL